MPRIKEIISKKLAKNQWGEADQENGIIYIDPKCKGIKDLEMVNHEGLHILCPWLSENAVRIIGAELTRVQWERGYRRIDFDATSDLQDKEHGLEDDTITLGKGI